MQLFDVAIVGGGPAGSNCAAFCAMAGLQSLVLDREKFPREKVCGDCLNPSCWSILERMDATLRWRICAICCRVLRANVWRYRRISRCRVPLGTASFYNFCAKVIRARLQ